MSNKVQGINSMEDDDDNNSNNNSSDDNFHDDDLPLARRKNKRSSNMMTAISSSTTPSRRRYSKTPLIALFIVGIFVIAAVIRGRNSSNNKAQPKSIPMGGAIRTQKKEHHYTNPYEASASGDGKEHTAKVINEKSSTGHAKSHGGWNQDDEDDEDWSCKTDFPDETAWNTWMNHISRLGPQSSCVRELKRPCHCRQPLDPIPRASNLWKQSLQRNQDLMALDQQQGEEHYQQQQQQQQQQLDVLMLGDSITEFWQGTKMGMTMPSLQATHQVYLDLFRRNNNNNNYNNNNEYVNTAPVHGLALGIAGDTCPQLLYRLQHNNELMLQHSSSSSTSSSPLSPPPPLPPRVYWILIGIHDYLSNACNAHVIAACNIKVVEYIQQQHQQHQNGTNATIVINSMLPLGQLRSHAAFREVSQINQQLECYAEHHEHVYFFNAYEDFLTTTTTTTTASSKTTTTVSTSINASLLQEDGVHPSTLGYQVWGNAIVEYVQELKRLKKIAP